MEDNRRRQEPGEQPPRPFDPEKHFFWIEAAFLLRAFRDFLSKSAWVTYILLCRRGSPRLCMDGLTRPLAFSGVNDVTETLGIPRRAAEKALTELQTKYFITPRPAEAPPAGKHFLKGAATEIMLLPMIHVESKMSIPNGTVPRVTANIFSSYLGHVNRPIFLPSNLLDDGKIKRLIRSWDALRLAFWLYNLVDHSEFGAVSWTLLSVDGTFTDEPVITIESDNVGNPTLVGKRVQWLDDFDKEGFRDAARYRLCADLYTPLGMNEADTIAALIMLKNEGVIRWKCVVVSPDPEDATLGVGGYENTPGQYPWLNKRPGMIPFISGYFGEGGPERPIFVVTPVFLAQTSRVRAYRGARAKQAKEFRARADEAPEAEEDDE